MIIISEKISDYLEKSIQKLEFDNLEEERLIAIEIAGIKRAYVIKHGRLPLTLTLRPVSLFTDNLL